MEYGVYFLYIVLVTEKLHEKKGEKIKETGFLSLSFDWHLQFFLLFKVNLITNVNLSITIINCLLGFTGFSLSLILL